MDIRHDPDLHRVAFQAAEQRGDLGCHRARQGHIDRVDFMSVQGGVQVRQACVDRGFQAPGASGVVVVADEVRHPKAGPGVSGKGAGGDLAEPAGADDGHMPHVPAPAAKVPEEVTEGQTVAADKQGHDEGEHAQLEPGGVGQLPPQDLGGGRGA